MQWDNAEQIILSLANPDGGQRPDAVALSRNTPPRLCPHNIQCSRRGCV
jgi:hypothetical protein